MANQTIERSWRIYKITCTITGKAYIGLTCDTVRQRWSNHVSAAIKRGQSISIFHRAIRKYGRDAFLVEALCELASLEEASAAEIKMIVLHNTLRPRGYNLATGGMGTPGVRRPHSAETKAKMSLSGKGRTFSEETRRKMSEAQFRRAPPSEQTRKKISDLHRGRIKSAEHRAKMSASTKGRKFPNRSIALLRSLLTGGPDRGIHKEHNKWVARLGMNRRRVHLGMFNTKDEARSAYVAAVQKRIAELETHQNAVPSANAAESQLPQ